MNDSKILQAILNPTPDNKSAALRHLMDHTARQDIVIEVMHVIEVMAVKLQEVELVEIEFPSDWADKLQEKAKEKVSDPKPTKHEVKPPRIRVENHSDRLLQAPIQDYLKVAKNDEKKNLTRWLNALRRAGITTMGALATMDEADLRAVHGIGGVAIGYIHEAVKRWDKARKAFSAP